MMRSLAPVLLAGLCLLASGCGDAQKKGVYVKHVESGEAVGLRDGERFQYEIRRRKRLVMAPLKSLDVATDEPDMPARLDP